MLQFSEKLLNNLMQIGLTVSLAALVPLILRRLMKKRYPARMVCVVWAILALRLLIPVQLTLPQAPVQVMPRTSYVVQSDQTAFRQAGLPVVQNPTRWVTGTQAQTLSAADTGTVKTVDITDILLTLWLAGVIACVLWQGIGYYRLIRSLKGTSQPVERADLHTILQEQCADLVIDREIPLRVSSAADCPMLAGFIHPTLYLPDERISRTDAAFIFRHELTHYKHGDLWLKLLLLAARCLHWFNPLVHLIARFAQEDIEAACDDAVVRGHDGAYRRAYGETILRSAIAQAQKRKALVSCFGDDKKTLMRRFEGLFDKSVKKRGVALVVMIALLVGSLSCTIAVGDNDKGLTKELRIQLAQKQANEAENLGYTVKLDGKDTYLITDREFSDNPGETIPGRVVQKLTFAKQDGEWAVSNSEIVPENGRVTSLDEFKLLYENDLGLPDFLSDSNQWKITNGYNISDPVNAAEVLLGIAPAVSQVEGSDEESAPYNDIRKVTFTFKDNSKVVVTMINQFGQGWLPQDWTDGSGVRSRTAADLAQQYARGVLHKSAQYIFPILTPDGQKDLIAQQMAMTGGEQWTWKYGPSSPSATDFVLVPTDDESSYCVVFRLSGSGVNDARSAYIVQTIRENKNSSVIGDIRELSTDSSTQSELFRTYYATGLSWPTVPQYIDSMDTQMIRGYADPAQAAMQYFGMALHGDSYLMLVKDTEVIRQATGSFGEGDSNTETAVVQLTFGDSSTPIKVQLEKTAAGYWQPVGVVEDITAKSGEQELGIGANARGALITGKLPPELAVGDTIKFTFANEPSGGVQLTNRLVNLDGTMQDALTDEQTVLTKTADGWTYTVPESMSKSLTSTAVEPYLHALVLEYTDARHIQHKAAALYALSNGEAATVVHGDETMNSVAYRNDVLGYTLEMPLSFRNTVGIRQYEDGSVHFNMLDEADSSSAHDICIMTLEAQPTAALKQSYGENWTENYAMPVKQLADQDGLTYFLIYASDVQYDPSNAEQAARYKELYTAAQDITADNFTLDDLTDKDNTARRRQLLEGLGRHYAARQGQTVRVYVDEKTNSCEVFFSRTDWETGYKTYAADRVTFKDVTTAEPTSVEHLADSAQGLTAAQFDLLYGTLDLPVYADDELANLQRVLQKDQIPEQGAAFFLGLGDMYGIFDGDSVKIYGDNNEFASLTYQFTDPNTGKENGKYVKLTMHKATADSSLPALWMPYSYELFTA
ncbi:M56 family metallopeptidase [Agathobaculum sp.]|uniref:M56 family metallopeptidase n=1 Tax=Agathobaculum sp. TaxID=2048138 RepID=UPI003AF1D753